MNAPSCCYHGGGRSFKPSSLKSRARTRPGKPGLNAVRYQYRLPALVFSSPANVATSSAWRCGGASPCASVIGATGPPNSRGVGFKSLKNAKYTEGKPMIGHINVAIERTHRLTGMPRLEIVGRGGASAGAWG